MRLPSWLKNSSSWLWSAALSGAVQRRLLAFALQKLIGSILQEDVRPEDIQLLFSKGVLVLSNLQLNCEFLNAVIPFPTIRVVKGIVRKLVLHVNLTDLVNLNVELEVQGLALDVTLIQTGEYMDSTIYQDASSQLDILDNVVDYMNKTASQDFEEEVRSEGLDDEIPDNSRNLLDNILQKCLASTSVIVEHLKLALKPSHYPTALEMSIDFINFSSFNNSSLSRLLNISGIVLSMVKQDNDSGIRNSSSSGGLAHSLSSSASSAMEDARSFFTPESETSESPTMYVSSAKEIAPSDPSLNPDESKETDRAIFFRSTGEFRCVFSIEVSTLLVIEAHVPPCVFDLSPQVCAFLLYLFRLFSDSSNFSNMGSDAAKSPFDNVQLDIHVSSFKVNVHCRLPDTVDCLTAADILDQLHWAPENSSNLEMHFNQIQISNDNHDLNDLFMTFSNFGIFMDDSPLISFDKAMHSSCSISFHMENLQSTITLRMSSGEISLPFEKFINIKEFFVTFFKDFAMLQNYFLGFTEISRRQDAYQSSNSLNVKSKGPTIEVIVLLDRFQFQLTKRRSEQLTTCFSIAASHLQLTRKSLGTFSSVLVFSKNISFDMENYSAAEYPWKSISSETVLRISNGIFETHAISGLPAFNVFVQQDEFYHPKFQKLANKSACHENHFYVAFDGLHLAINKEVIESFKSLIEDISAAFSNPVTPKNRVQPDFRNFLKIRIRDFSLRSSHEDGNSLLLKSDRIKHYMSWVGAELISLDSRTYNLSAYYSTRFFKDRPLLSVVRNFKNGEKYILNLSLTFFFQNHIGSTNELQASVIDLGYEHYIADFWLTNFLKTYFPQDPEVPFLEFPRFPYSINLTVSDCILGLNPSTMESKLLMHLKALEIQVGAILLETTINIKAFTSEAFLYIINKLNEDVMSEKKPLFQEELWKSDAKLSQMAADVTIGFVIQSLGYIELARISGLNTEVTVRINNGDLATYINLNNADLHLQSCADSTQLFFQIISDCSTPKNDNQVKDYLVSPNPSYTDLLREVDTEFFADIVNLRSLRSSDTDISVSNQTLDIVNDYYTSSVSSEDKSSQSAASRDSSQSEILSDDYDDLNFSDEEALASEDNLKQDIELIEDHFLSQGSIEHPNHDGEVNEYDMKLVISNVRVSWELYDGYDWNSTRHIISEAIETFLQNSKTKNKDGGKTHVFESICLEGFSQIEKIYFDKIAEAIDVNYRTESLSKYERQHILRLGRSNSNKVMIEIIGLMGSFTSLRGEKVSNDVLSELELGIKDLTIYDHLLSSTWNKFFSRDTRSPSSKNRNHHMNIRFATVRPLPELMNNELRVEIGILPSKMYIDQDTLDFIIRFFTFKPEVPTETDVSTTDLPFFQSICVHATHFTVDYKFKNPNPAGIKSGRLPDFGNFLVVQGSEVFLRQLQIYGLSGIEEFLHALLTVWFQDIRNSQLQKVLNGLVPIRTLFTVGSGVKDIFVSPVKGLQKKRSMRRFRHGVLKFTGKYMNDLLSFNAQGMTGTHALLKQVEEYLQSSRELRSRRFSYYANQPESLEQGLLEGYHGFRQGLVGARTTLQSIPGEASQSASLGSAAQVVSKKMPLAMLKPMVGATEAVSKTLWGLSNSLQPQRRHNLREKYKR
ncbi:autophagy associated intermembrane lipid transfer protein Atg2 [Schizosaccharomyces osmophilus]|uniref:Autophagy-related protein 2 n=1 Tax=Schizosaccharomyces osmophilus TaxID=2545709 RepID=A0AAF0AV00_9SCHI|nr:autophagy associated intermembrane lipid transfer protein Atg2 [Schizosaccharomyces osmophilus]WBW73036.1 autophagy associated intermembrane lipid transfer protein Atg2 [Schizosaccharomyces osmophilus]